MYPSTQDGKDQEKYEFYSVLQKFTGFVVNDRIRGSAGGGQHPDDVAPGTRDSVLTNVELRVKKSCSRKDLKLGGGWVGEGGGRDINWSSVGFMRLKYLVSH